MRMILLFCLLSYGCSSGANVVEEIHVVTPSTASAPAKKTYLYWYTAPWCGPCRQDEPVMLEWARERGLKVSDVPDGNCPINRINTDEVVSIRKIESIPTYLIVTEDGTEIWRHEGRIDLTELNTQWNSRQ